MFGINLVRSPASVSGTDVMDLGQALPPAQFPPLGRFAPEPSSWAIVGGTSVDLRGVDGAVAEIIDAAVRPQPKPLAVASANLDHVFHFGAGGRWENSLETAGSVNWLTLLDGVPLRSTATHMTGRQWPRLAGSDLIVPLLDQAEAQGLTVGFLGGSLQTQQLLQRTLKEGRPRLQVVGWWAPERAELASPAFSTELAQEIALNPPDLLVVGLGKPRQELWINEYGALTGAPVLLAFGAVVDFLAGRIKRAPEAMSGAGLEWAWRLALEPRRLANRYLVQGPEAYWRMKRISTLVGFKDPAGGSGMPGSKSPKEVMVPAPSASTGPVGGRFLPREAMADVTVVVVTYNSAADIEPLLACLRTETTGQSLKVVVADNGSTDATVELLARHPDVVLVPGGGNRGYAGGINAALRHAGPHCDVLVLNPDLRILPGAIATLRERMARSGAGIVVPRLLDDDGTIYTSLRREPSTLRAIGDAFMGSKVSGRPEWLSEIDYCPESYDYPHAIEWATGAALLISGAAVARVGEWDERYFLYSEETDYFRRVRASGRSIWFEPAATMVHSRGGSGSSPELTALMAINRVRYARAHHSRVYAEGIRAAATLGTLARIYKEGEREACRALVGLRPWDGLPHAVPAPVPVVAQAPFPGGAVIIPAHNEASVIARTLRPLGALAASGAIEVIVACNGCTDATAVVAASFPGVQVLELAQASKTAALNAADAACSRWPRLYLDADIETTADALAAVFQHLAAPGSLSARPAFSYDTTGCSPLVKAYYRARARIPSHHEHLWGAGAYAVSAAGHERFAVFPPATADDAYVDSLFTAEEKAILATAPVIVRTPASTPELLRTLRRIYQGKHELQSGRRDSAGLRNLLRSVNGLVPAFDAGVYGSLAVLGKLQKRSSLARAGGWDRDESRRA
ncbi:WecB/TagA/CpsF family glycosyltransferase [Specibacter sp. NPDC057265]|uniref:WecB/TagA/CpsF family glycosyltransferase n=1 Tax=Specibacter sp. NPDC057265 TaxID=3346075 RepID=UPI00363897ED